MEKDGKITCLPQYFLRKPKARRTELVKMLLKKNQKMSFGYRYDVQELTLSQKFMSTKMSILLNDTLGFWCDEQDSGRSV